MKTSKLHTYKGWQFQMQSYANWLLVRTSDGFTTHHNSFDGCKLFIRDHGDAADPDASYEAQFA